MELPNLNFSQVRPFVPGDLEESHIIHRQPNGAEGFESWHLQQYFDQNGELFERKRKAMMAAWDQFQLDKAGGISAIMSGARYQYTLEDAQRTKNWKVLINRAIFDKIVDHEFPEGLPKITN